MDVIDGLRQDVAEGRIGPERLLDLFEATLRLHGEAKQQLGEAKQQIDESKRQLKAANERIEELERQIGGGPARPTESYSVDAEEKRQEQRGKKKKKKKKPKRSGRFRTCDKIAMAERVEKCYPEGVPEHECVLARTRPVWRVENGRSVLVAYEIYRGPKNQHGQIPGVLGRSEFGLEIVVELAHLIYELGLSFDKACALLAFFQNLKISKSQADALLKQLSRHWEKEFDALCVLLANSAVVHADETSWSLNSVWALLSEKARILLYGVHKNGETLKAILDPATFGGLVVSDDAAVYGGFLKSQKCWAHLLRKGIKYALMAPNNKEYREFIDRLLEIYREARRVQQDGRLSDAGRAEKVVALSDAIFELCIDETGAADRQGLAHDFYLLNCELFRLMTNNELFQFVLAAPVEQPNGETKPVSGTNNEAERILRDPAQARDTGRTNKTPAGARRQTINKSVFESLKLYLPAFTLRDVIAEIRRWWDDGTSCFRRLLETLKLKLPDRSVLDELYPPQLPEPSS